MSINQPAHFDLLVIGAGHAGIEAARAAAKMGQRVGLVTLDRQKIGAMSCNPAIGGVAKGHLVFEIDALGGVMGEVADSSAIQAKRLNTNRGPAVRSTRVQCDKDVYALAAQKILNRFDGIDVVQGEAGGLLFDERMLKVKGCRLVDGSELFSRAVVVSSGTFMRGLMFLGRERKVGGRFGDKASDTLSESLVRAGHSFKRLKTGTPARLSARTIAFARLARQWGDPEKRFFSWRGGETRLPQISCFITYTNEKTHQIIRDNFSRSALFSGDIQGVGPRYCPSVEDKIKRFADRDRHQIFLEPEGLNTDSVYPNGLSTSLPEDVQLEFLRSIEGLENVELIRPGYAVEYDAVDPRELFPSFMSRKIEGLFLAGQVNRTSGYEEAAAQGLWAGLNAGLYLQGKEMLKPLRSRSYIETLVDDLVTLGSEEPYRLFTSRSEFRLLLREDNAGERLLALGKSLGLLEDSYLSAFDKKQSEISTLRTELSEKRIRIDKDRVYSLVTYLKRPEVSWESLSSEISVSRFNDEVLERIETEVKYEGYLDKQESELRELQKVQDWGLDLKDGFEKIPGLSSEIIEKLRRDAPKSVYELTRISGVTPTAVLLLAKGYGSGVVSRETISN